MLGIRLRRQGNPWGANFPTELGRGPRKTLPTLLAITVSCLCLLAGCATSDRSSGGGTKGGSQKATLRLGYFPNLTHAPALLGLRDGIFERHLAGAAKIEYQSMNAGPAAVEALFSGALDASYIGPGPAINAHVRSGGKATRIISGSTEGGAALVVQPSIARPEDLKGKKVASPQLGNTQDIALRTWLRSKGLSTNLQGGGEVSVVPQENSQTLETFRVGEIAGAWLPEPWASRLVVEAGAKVLVDESTLWPEGRFPTTVLVVRSQYLREHPRVVRALLEAHKEAVGLLNSDRQASIEKVNQMLGKETGKPLPTNVLEPATRNLRFTTDLQPEALKKVATEAKELGLLKNANLDGAFDLRLLNEVQGGSG